MCGIIGYVGDERAPSIVYEGLENLEYRGYDSAGIAVVDGYLTVTKRAGEVAELEPPAHNGARCAIGHTRWSTHGPPTDDNAHPHTDCEGRVAVVHNGIIENHAALRREVEDCTFSSETDTEVIPHLIERELAEGVDLLEAVEAVARRLEGSYAICAVDATAERIVATRNGSPLVLGHVDEGGFVASDVPAFLGHTREVTYLDDGDIAEVSTDGVRVRRDGTWIDLEIDAVDWDAESAEKGGYEHYMRKEIHEQPQALRQTIAGRLDREAGRVDLEVTFPTGYLDSLEEVQFVAAGTSHYAAQYGARLVERWGDVRTSVSIASEYTFGGGRDPWRTLTVAVSQSGETADTLRAVRSAARAGARTLAVTNVIGSTITREVDDAVYIKAGPEIGVAASKTFASQVTSLAMLAVAIGRERGVMSRSSARGVLRDLDGLPGAVQQVLDREASVERTARAHLDADAFFFVGRELGFPVALEGALKLKEIAYVHAEGFGAGELKHGPLALVTEVTPVVAVLTEGAAPEATLHNVAEAQARGSPVLGVVTEGRSADRLEEAFPVPALGVFEPLVANVYLQLFAYHVANALGRPIDKPRNLAKSVTVG